MPAIYRQFDYAASNSSVPETVVVDDDNVQLHIRLLTETTTTSTDESTLFDTSGSLYASTTSEPENHHANFVWYEDWYDDQPPSAVLPAGSNPPIHRYAELSPLLPFGMMLIISMIIFMLIIFRRFPGLVAGIVAGCLTSMSIYLLLLALKEQRPVYE